MRQETSTPGSEPVDRRRELMRRLLADVGLGGDAPEGGIPVRDQAAATPLSAAQRSLWLHHQAHPESTSYNGCLVIELTGPLDGTALATALHGLAMRHEILRTVYRVGDNGTPHQVVAEAPKADIPLRDLTAVPPTERRHTADAVAVALASRPFDLAHEHPVRWELLRFAADAHALVQVVHHIAWDGGTWGVLSRDLAALYRAAVAGQDAPAAPEVQYADFAAWQRSREPDPADTADKGTTDTDTADK
ncbi:MAG: hypothetical protein HOV68_31580, partial [Streptomycetaceae bacterium]|nr:hypothetical protein [Streptomycetaceae bacterium]